MLLETIQPLRGHSLKLLTFRRALAYKLKTRILKPMRARG